MAGQTNVVIKSAVPSLCWVGDTQENGFSFIDTDGCRLLHSANVSGLLIIYFLTDLIDKM